MVFKAGNYVVNPEETPAAIACCWGLLNHRVMMQQL
jgi:hypothetical protein